MAKITFFITTYLILRRRKVDEVSNKNIIEFLSIFYGGDNFFLENPIKLHSFKKEGSKYKAS